MKGHFIIISGVIDFTGTKAVSLWSFTLFHSSLSVGHSSLHFCSSFHTLSSVVRVVLFF